MSSEKIPPGGPGITWDVLNNIFQILVTETGNSPSYIMTRHKLQLQIPNYPDSTILGCLMTYQHDGHIACSRNGEDITPKNMKTDYEEFHLTASVKDPSGVYVRK